MHGVVHGAEDGVVVSVEDKKYLYHLRPSYIIFNWKLILNNSGITVVGVNAIENGLEGGNRICTDHEGNINFMSFFHFSLVKIS